MLCIHNVDMASATEAVMTAACHMGFSKLTPHQEQATIAFVNGKDVFVSLPTGSGKTVCFALLPFTLTFYWENKGALSLSHR